MWIWEFDKIKQYFLLLLTMFTDTQKFFLKTKLSRVQAEHLVCIVMYITMLPLLFTIILIPFLLLVPLYAWLSRVLFEFFVGIIAGLVRLRIKDLHTLWALMYAPYVFAILAITQPIASLASLVAYIYLLVERYKATGGQVLLMILLTTVLVSVVAAIILVPFLLFFGFAWFTALL